MNATFIDCADCGSEHLGPACGMSFAQRLRTVQLDRASMDTVDLRNYYDREAITTMFGHDAKDRYMEETNGLGAAYPSGDGGYLRRDRRTGERVRVTDAELDLYLGADTEESG